MRANLEMKEPKLSSHTQMLLAAARVHKHWPREMRNAEADRVRVMLRNLRAEEHAP